MPDPLARKRKLPVGIVTSGPITPIGIPRESAIDIAADDWKSRALLQAMARNKGDESFDEDVTSLRKERIPGQTRRGVADVAKLTAMGATLPLSGPAAIEGKGAMALLKYLGGHAAAAGAGNAIPSIIERAVAGEDQDVGEIGKDLAIGGAIGAALPGAFIAAPAIKKAVTSPAMRNFISDEAGELRMPFSENGIKFNHDPYAPNKTFGRLDATTPEGEHLGSMLYTVNPDGTLRAEDVMVAKEHRRKGIATEMYNQLKRDTGRDLAPPSDMSLSTEGRAFRAGYDAQEPIKHPAVTAERPTERRSLSAENADVRKRFDEMAGDIRGLSDERRKEIAAALRLEYPSKTVSTRVPTAKKATEDPLREKLFVGLESSRMDPKAFETNARLVEQYPNMPADLVGAPAEDIAEKYIDESTNNLLWLHDQVPEPVRQRSKKWYVGARKIVDDWSGEHQIPDRQIGGVLAVLSPQKDWFMNTSLADRVIRTVKNNYDTPWSKEMSRTAERIFAKPQYEMLRRNIEGRRLADLTDPIERAAWVRAYDEAHNARQYPLVHPEGDFAGPVLTSQGVPGKVAWGSLNEISKAINILNDGSPENISRQLGGQHKVRNFFNNIIDPYSAEGHVTADTHAVAANLLRPLSGQSAEVLHNFGSGGASSSSVFGSKGTYGLNVEPYRRAASERGILPREMQSITWEAVRGLFPSTFKSQARNVNDIDAIWEQYRNGRLSLDEARRAVSERAGGIRNPDWVRE